MKSSCTKTMLSLSSSYLYHDDGGGGSSLNQHQQKIRHNKNNNNNSYSYCWFVLLQVLCLGMIFDETIIHDDCIVQKLLQKLHHQNRQHNPWTSNDATSSSSSNHFSSGRRNRMTGFLFCHGEEFNTQIMLRVSERLNDFLNIPIRAVEKLIEYRRVGSFAYNMTALDHDHINRYLLTEEKAFGTQLYFGLEDGTFFLSSGDVVYREPGNDGYDASTDENIHSRTCIDPSTYQPAPCIASNGTKYISCIDNCTLVACPTASKMRSATKSWCINYEIKEMDNRTNHMGYVPMYNRCSNRHGQPEQRPGYVVVEATKDNNNQQQQPILVLGQYLSNLGNCYHDDGVTIVNHTMNSPFAVCGGTKNCSIPSRGAVSSRPYDPRYRGWYIGTKQKQGPIWTAPYAFLPDLYIGITYSHPIYNDILPLIDDDGNKDDAIEKKTIFQGVVAVDYTLDEIDNFITTQYSDTNMHILIVERTGPDHNLIAISTRNGQVLNAVLSSDPSQPCPPNLTTVRNACDLLRVPVAQLQHGHEHNDEELRVEMALYQAFVAHQQTNFSIFQRLNIKIDPQTIGSPAYVAESQLYQLGGGGNEQQQQDIDDLDKQWQIFVVVPMPRLQDDTLQKGETAFWIVIIIGAIGFTACFFIMIQFYIRRKEKAMIQADWQFTSLFLLGCSILNLSTFTLLGDNTNQLCMLRMWSFNGLFACTLSPLFVKVWRMYLLLKVEVSYRRESLSTLRALLMTVPIIVAQFILLLIFSIVDPPRQTEHLGVHGGMDDSNGNTSSSSGSSSTGSIGYQSITCEQQSDAFFYAQVFYDALLLSIGCILAYLSRDLDPKFGEAKQLAFSMYNLAFTGIVAVVTIRFVDLDHSSQSIIQAFGVLWGSFFCCMAFVLPRLLQNQKYKRESQCSSNYESSHYTSSQVPYSLPDHVSATNNLNDIHNDNNADGNNNRSRSMNESIPKLKLSSCPEESFLDIDIGDVEDSYMDYDGNCTTDRSEGQDHHRTYNKNDDKNGNYPLADEGTIVFSKQPNNNHNKNYCENENEALSMTANVRILGKDSTISTLFSDSVTQ